MSASTAERGRITARVPAYAQEVIEQAAMLTATTTNQFVAQAALREAERIVKESQRIRMSARMDFLFCRGAWSERGALIQSRIIRASRRPWPCATPPATCAPRLRRRAAACGSVACSRRRAR
ncbi:DUF1778 domain-containing protein [Xanthomonas translucens pv. phlei]|nr:DUF1778 domain-containing protein [Xanthomonas translucens pv. phlei]